MSQAAPRQASAPSSTYAWYVLLVLLAAYVLNFVDRQLLAVAASAIKHELGISDTQLGFLLGPAFGLFYTFAGVPIARLADRTSRRNVMAVGLTLWSLMTAATGLAQHFAQIAACRFAVGVGEAAGTPPAHSLISDYFPPERRATALSIYANGIYLGVGFGFIGGGLLLDQVGWHAAFLLAGLLGLPLALLLRTTVREPRRGAAEPGPVDTELPRLGLVLRILFARRSFVLLTLGACFQSIAGYAVLSWAPIFLMRVHAMSATEMGLTFGTVAALTGAAGATLGGRLADRLGRRDERWYVWLPALISLLAAPFAIPFYLAENRTLALASFGTYYLINNIYVGPLWSVAQNLVKVRMRATASAVMLAILNVAGLVVGPQLVGVLNDALAPRYGDDAVRYSLLAMAALGAGAAIFFWRCAFSLRQELVSRPGDTRSAGA